VFLAVRLPILFLDEPAAPDGLNVKVNQAPIDFE